MSWKIKTLEELFEKGSSKLTLKAVKDCVGPFKVFGANGLCGHSDQYDQEQQYFAVIKDGAGVGRISFHEPQSSVLGTMQYLIPRGHENFRFLHYALLNLKLSSFAVGSTIPHIYFKDYKGLNVGVPTLEEQERSVEILDEAFAAIDKAKANIERNLTNARELFQSRLNDIFSNPSEDWEELEFGDVFNPGQGIQVPLEEQHIDCGDNMIRFIRISDYTKAAEPLRFCIHPGARFVVSESELVMIRYGTPGRVCFGIRGAIANNLIRLNLNDTSDALFMYYQMSTDSVQTFLRGQSSLAMPAITFKRLHQLMLLVPRIEVQKRFGGEMKDMSEHVSNLTRRYQIELDNLEELRQSILEQAFEGKLTEPVAA